MRTLFLSGPMGSGKSTVGAAVASRLGVPFVDLDARIEARAEKPITRIFAEDGERAFRRIERELARGELGGGRVVALGGGAVVHPETRHALLEGGTVVTLQAPIDVLLERVGAAESRPLLGASAPDEKRTVLEELLRARASAYRECHATVETGGRSVDDIADEVIRVARDVRVAVALGERSYAVEIGAGVRDRLPTRVAAACEGPVLVVHDADDGRPWPDEAQALVTKLGRDVIPVQLARGEKHKRIRTVEAIWDAGLGAGVDRRALVLGVGGGVVGDLAGFGASTLLRGVALGQLPTTLLAMVDSSVGGKTGFNRAQGKNLVGTFYQPRFVLCDVETLSTLEDEERIAGLAEVVKSAWIDGEASVAALEEDATALRDGDVDATIRAIEMSVRLKSRIVREDEREGGRRMLLNRGHTVGHGLEAAAGYVGLRHGEAVALGMIAALRVGVSLARTTPAVVERLGRLLSAMGLPADLDSVLSEEAIDFVASDKKKRGSAIRFIVPGAPGETEIVPLTLETIRASVAPS